MSVVIARSLLLIRSIEPTLPLPRPQPSAGRLTPPTIHTYALQALPTMAPSLRRPVLLLLAAAVAAIPTSTAFLLPPPPSCRSPSSTHRLPAAPAQAEAAAAAIAEGDDDDGTTRLRLGVYIEHTDRYGMVYNSNYLLFLNR